MTAASRARTRSTKLAYSSAHAWSWNAVSSLTRSASTSARVRSAGPALFDGRAGESRGRGRRGDAGDATPSHRSRPARAERPEVGVHRHAVEPDGVLDRLGADRQRARLVGGAHQDHVGVLLVAEQVRGQRRRVEEAGRAHLRLDRGRHPAGRGEALADVGDHLPGRYLGGGDHGHRPVLARGAELGAVGGDEGVAAEVQVAFAVAELGGALGWPGADGQVGHDRAALLRQAGLVEGAHLLPVGGEGGAEDLRDGHHAGAADAGDAHREAIWAEEPLGSASVRRLGLAGAGPAGRRATRRARLARAGVTVRKDGQSPSRQEKSRLQEDWWIRVLRPNSVATG